MNFLELQAYAKINLGINVLEKLENGYHRVDMVMHTVALCDTLSIGSELSDQTDIALEFANGIENNMPADIENLAYKAADELLKYISQKARVCINLTKKIPVAAGLAGGSSDAATVLLGLNKLLGSKLKLNELAEIGAKIGADVVFCIYANALGNKVVFEELSEADKKRTSFCMRAQGIGEILTRLEPLSGRIILFKIAHGISTREVYDGFDDLAEKCSVTPNIENLVAEIQAADIDGVVKNAGNALEAYTLIKYPQIYELKKKLSERLGAKLVMMSGSGPTIFALCDENVKIDLDLEYFGLEKANVFDTYLMKGGIDDVRLKCATPQATKRYNL
ncbi:MAG: 4-(cytidine 5'-diphospho)-2-C-methyl-D-erythritol kinase [Eubacteriales bacterium]